MIRSGSVSDSKVFSKLDLYNGYYQVPMCHDYIQKTVIVMLFGMFEFLCLPNRIRNTGNSFERMMDQILVELPIGFVSGNDILIFSSDLDTWVHPLRQFIELLRYKGLTISFPKYVFPVTKLEFLGHQLSSSGYSLLDKHASAISYFPLPSDRPALQRFLGI